MLTWRGNWLKVNTNLKKWSNKDIGENKPSVLWRRKL